MPNSWIAPPGVIYGCKLRVEPGLSLTLEKGKVVTPNSYAIEISEDVRGAILVRPATSVNRMDYVALCATEGGASIRYICGEETDDVLNQMPKLLQSGVMLAKLFVTYPTAGPESVYIYHSMPARGEPIIRGLRSTTIPDGVRKTFVFQAPCPDGYSLYLRVYGISQRDGIDYVMEQAFDLDGPVTRVTFDEAPPSRADISADVYAGSVRL